MKVVIFIFRRDLRIYDNVAFDKAVEYAQKNKCKLLPVFIFNPKQIDKDTNKYFGNFTVKFMIESLEDLDSQLNECGSMLHTFHAEDEHVLKHLSSVFEVSAVAFNCDYTPFARKRDTSIQFTKLITSWNEYSLVDIVNMEKPYKVYGAFKNKYMNHDVQNTSQQKIPKNLLLKEPLLQQLLPKSKWHKFYEKSKTINSLLIGGRTHGLQRLATLKKCEFENYSTDRDFPYMNKTTLLSPYLKYGCVSIREVYWTVHDTYGPEHNIIQELYWRAFYEQMVYWFPETLQGQVSNKPNASWTKTEHEWNNDPKIYQKVCTATTGVPIIDASLKCLYETGFMHNRLRMILCMYLCRHLKQDWRIYEMWFAQHTVDYYPSANRGGWEWSVLYRFKLSPHAQVKRFDPDCLFIKKWLPQYSQLSPKDILKMMK
jgi:deoxyribodipyrimidine photo-lyase